MHCIAQSEIPATLEVQRELLSLGEKSPEESIFTLSWGSQEGTVNPRQHLQETRLLPDRGHQLHPLGRRR